MRQELREKCIKEVYGQKKKRDYAILELSALQPHLTYKELIEYLALDITEPRISEILTENKDLRFKLFASLNPLYLKEGRAIELVATYLRKKRTGQLSKKDMVDVLEQLRKEIEGDKPLVSIENHDHKTFVYLDSKALQEENAGNNRIKTELPAEQI